MVGIGRHLCPISLQYGLPWIERVAADNGVDICPAAHEGKSICKVMNGARVICKEMVKNEGLRLRELSHAANTWDHLQPSKYLPLYCGARL